MVKGAAQLGETHSAPISFPSHVASAGSVSSTARCILGHCRGSRLELLRRISRSIQQFRRTTREAELHYGSDSRCTFSVLRAPFPFAISRNASISRVVAEQRVDPCLQEAFPLNSMQLMSLHHRASGCDEIAAAILRIERLLRRRSLR